MKFRIGFVSNSSSASFIIHKRHLTQDQIKQILEYDEPSDSWDMREWEDCIKGWTIMDNGGLEEFLELLGIENVYEIS